RSRSDLGATWRVRPSGRDPCGFRGVGRAGGRRGRPGAGLARAAGDPAPHGGQSCGVADAVGEARIVTRSSDELWSGRSAAQGPAAAPVPKATAAVAAALGVPGLVTAVCAVACAAMTFHQVFPWQDLVAPL